jgi:hypothetical protein
MRGLVVALLLILFFIGLSAGLWLRTGATDPLVPLLLLVEVTLALAVAFLLVLARGRTALPPLSPEAEDVLFRIATEPNYGVRQGVADLLRLGQRLEATLVYRRVTGAGAEQARDEVAAIERETGGGGHE